MVFESLAGAEETAVIVTEHSTTEIKFPMFHWDNRNMFSQVQHTEANSKGPGYMLSWSNLMILLASF